MFAVLPIALVSGILFLGGWALSSGGAGKYVTIIKRIFGFAILVSSLIIHSWYKNNIGYDRDNGAVSIILLSFIVSGIAFGVRRSVGALILAASYAGVLIFYIFVVNANA
ncbi:hypothetical protein [Bosea thiooxidans]